MDTLYGTLKGAPPMLAIACAARSRAVHL